ncbi:uncharacterized protein LOC125883384 [Epinephelus fuscoguttatus]|uniref:uncharacterized protein LOC125883384 n=1 Tax=Epinephelus fuscoguttatus TaxID=293821 RepID=UPI0020D00057|nr:uncharacterized protein LOC125883384 [Epinephelus fuscoguttatus]
MSVDKTKMNFLDIMVIKEEDHLKTDLYRKPTDKNSLLHEKEDIRSLGSRRLCHVLATCLKRNASPTPDQGSEQGVICAIQYSPVAKDITKTIKQHWHIIDSDPTLKDIFIKPPRVVYKRPPNLRNMLVRADLPPPPPPSHFLGSIASGNYPCGRCQQCHFTQKTVSFNHPHTGKKYNVKGIITCSTTNVIYMLKCPCGLAYIGKTTRALKTRIAEHRSTIRNEVTSSPVAVHFSAARHNISTLRYVGIETLKCPRRGGDINSLLLKGKHFGYIHWSALQVCQFSFEKPGGEKGEGDKDGEREQEREMEDDGSQNGALLSGRVFTRMG